MKGKLWLIQGSKIIIDKLIILLFITVLSQLKLYSISDTFNYYTPILYFILTLLTFFSILCETLFIKQIIPNPKPVKQLIEKLLYIILVKQLLIVMLSILILFSSPMTWIIVFIVYIYYNIQESIYYLLIYKDVDKPAIELLSDFYNIMINNHFNIFKQYMINFLKGLLGLFLFIFGYIVTSSIYKEKFYNYLSRFV